MVENVKVLKLETGEEVVAQIDEGDDDYVIINPVKFMMVQNAQQGVGMEMHPYIMLTSDTEFTLPKNRVVLLCEPVPEIMNAYSNQFNDIAVPPQPQIIT